MTKILVVDDQLVMRNMFKSIFTNTDYHIDLACDGKEAYTKATKTRYDMVLTDLYMPVLDGISLTRKLRLLNTYKGVPIFVVSTESAKNKKSEGKAAGATGWIVKPISEKKLLPAIKIMMG